MTTVDAYLARIGIDRPPVADLGALAALQFAHLVAVPFENLDVHDQRGVSTDVDVTLAKIVDRGRGGWCFENNGAFAWLLEQLGFEVRRLGAAVLLAGPNTVVSHLCLEVMLERPYLVDVGFGDSFQQPLPLDSRGPHPGGDADYELLPSPQGTTLAKIVDGVPAPQYRFKRVTHRLAEFESASRDLQADADGNFRRAPFATRLLGSGDDRVTLLGDRLKLRRGGVTDETPVEPESDEWHRLLADWFGLRRR